LVAGSFIGHQGVVQHLIEAPDNDAEDRNGDEQPKERQAALMFPFSHFSWFVVVVSKHLLFLQYYARKRSPRVSAKAQIVGFGFQDSGVGCQGTDVLNPDT